MPHTQTGPRQPKKVNLFECVHPAHFFKKLRHAITAKD